LFSLWELLHALRTYQLYVNIFQGIVLTTWKIFLATYSSITD
jgi:hypothetical protein